MATRRSIGLSATSSEMRPSCGIRRSAMSRSERILMREMTAGTALERHGGGFLEHAVDAVAHAHLVLGRLEVDVRGAALDGFLDHPVHELDDRRVLAADAEVDRGVLAEVVLRGGGLVLDGGAGARLGALLVLVGCDRAVTEVRVLEAFEQPFDVVVRGHGRAHLVARHDRDVVDREHVGRVDHRDQQRAVADEGDRHRLVAAHGGWGDELGGVGIDAVELEIDVVEAEALGDAARELIVRQRAVADQDALGRGAALRGAVDRLIDRAAVDETEVDEHIRQHAAGPATPGWHGDPVSTTGLRRSVVSRAHRAMSATASRIALSGAVRPVQRSSEAAPCATSISSPSTTSAPFAFAVFNKRVPPCR